MCGIAGHVGGRVVAPLADGVLDALRHRGPDAQRTERRTTGSVVADLAFARLAILDLSDAGQQPMSSEDGRFTMVFNGEIYNSPALRGICERAGHRFRSAMDGEVILHLWEMEGPSALQLLNGIFAVAVLDAVTGELFLARDPLGVKPLIYAEADGELWFASELGALLAMGAPTGGADLVALAQFLSFLWIPDPRTPYAGLHGVEPGTVVRWTRDGSSVSRYCEPLHPTESPPAVDPEDAVEELRSRLTDAVRRQLLSDVPIAVMASGGVDSSLIWWAAGDSVERAYTIDWAGTTGGERLSEDAATVRALSDLLGTPVTYVAGEDASGDPPRSGDLFADPAHDLARTISRRAAGDGFKVLLCGQGGDELFAGYRRHHISPILGQLHLGGLGMKAERVIARCGSGLGAEYLARLARAASERDPFASYMQICTYSTAADRARVLGCTEQEASNDAVWRQHRVVFDALPAGVSFLRKVMALELAVYLPGLGLAYIDRASMEHGVEVRVPWLDLELVRWSLALPDSVLIRGQRAKWLPKELAARVVSPQVALRAKRGFAAPAHRVAVGRAPGSRGFRQGRYFALAASIVERHCAGASGHERVPRPPST
ncbi:MAG TPA: asparagine synthase (glutamine-hydrolyzing) [Actinobacteria bacterium]|nr:asparagine synthase (glutamine-hydrolyzing) [Actinomycetota bacterium]